MMFTISGLLYYANGLNGMLHELEKGSWICEHTLWVSWRHCGELRAASECRLLATDAAIFQELVARYFSTAGCFGGVHPSKYALEFVKRLNNTDAGDFSDITLKKDVEEELDRAYPKGVRFHLTLRRDSSTEFSSSGTLAAGVLRGPFIAYLPRCIRNR